MADLYFVADETWCISTVSTMFKLRSAVSSVVICKQRVIPRHGLGIEAIFWYPSFLLPERVEETEAG